jgi:hypothetical protein
LKCEREIGRSSLPQNNVGGLSRLKANFATNILVDDGLNSVG